MADRRTPRRRSRVRFRLTVGGWLFLGVSLLVCAAAINSQAPLLFILFGAMIGALHVSAVLSRRMVVSVQLRRDVPPRVWQNQTVHLGYYLSNPRRRGSLLGLSIEELAPVGIQCAPGYCVNLPPRATFRAGGRFAARRRGRIRMDRVRVASSFPFGLITAHRTLRRPADLVVWPARGRLRAPLLHSGAAETSRAAPSPATGGQDEFFGLREYRQDDNPRWIHWRRSANRPVPVVREMARPLPEVLWVVLDTAGGFSHSPAPELERRIRFAGTLIDHALGRGYLVGLALATGDRVAVYAPAGGRGQQCELLDALADADGRASPTLADTVRGLPAGLLRDATVVAVEGAHRDAARSGAPHSPPARGRADAPLDLLRGRCRHLAVITPGRLEQVFLDEGAEPPPVAVGDGGPSAGEGG